MPNWSAVVARIDTRNSSRYWRDHRVLGLSCLLADFTAHDYAPHSHDALVLVVNGSEAGPASLPAGQFVSEAVRDAS